MNAKADAGGAHDCIAIDASQAFGRADRTAFGEGADDGDLLLESKHVHGANP